MCVCVSLVAFEYVLKDVRAQTGVCVCVEGCVRNQRFAHARARICVFLLRFECVLSVCVYVYVLVYEM